MLRAIRLSRSFVLGHGRLAPCRTNFLRLNYLTFALTVRTNREMSTITAIATTNAPSAIGPYSQAIKAGDFVFVSGCIPLVPSTMQIVEGGIEEQTKQALSNLEAVLEASASSVGKVVKTTVFLKNMGDFATVNKIYEEFFSGSEHKPARSAVEVARLPKDVLFEIECIAVASK